MKYSVLNRIHTSSEDSKSSLILARIDGSNMARQSEFKKSWL